MRKRRAGPPNLRDSYSASAAKQLPQLQIVDLDEMIIDLIQMLRRLIGKNVELRFVQGPEKRMAIADRGQIEQVLTNLILNARDAMPDGGRLLLGTDNVLIEGARAKAMGLRPGSYVRVTVADSGCGMDKETLGKIFDPFFSTKEVGEGTGLGLSVAHGLICQHQGTIRVKSDLALGATFDFYLPAADPEPASATDGAEADRDRGSMKSPPAAPWPALGSSRA